MSLMWGDPHILEFNNSQYAYDKYKLKLEPIPQDVGIGPREIKSSENILHCHVNILIHVQILIFLL